MKVNSILNFVINTFRTALAPVVLGVVLTGCGGDAEQAGQKSDYATYTVASAADLPTCDTSRLGQLYYVESDQNFQTCKAEGWIAINVRGQDGEDGADGISLKKSVYCSASNVLSTTVDIAFEWHRFTDGTVFTSCKANNANIAAQNTRIFSPTLTGSQTAICVLSFDLEQNGSDGFFIMTNDSTTNLTSSTAYYLDATSAANGQNYSFDLTNDCTILDF